MHDMNDKEQQYFLNAGFTADQIAEIAEGREAGINTSVYANKKYLAIQMRQIRLGLQEHYPAELYANPEYDWFQMEEIRKGLRDHVDTSLYASPEIPYDKMRQIRKGLRNGINLLSYVKYDAGILRQLRKARMSGANILRYISEGYDAEQLYEIRLAMENGVDLTPYLSKEYRGASLAEIRKGLEIGLDVGCYANTGLRWRQMREIRLGLEHRVDIKQYASVLYSWEQMREIRLGLEQGLSVDSYKSLMYPAEEMKRKRLSLLDQSSQEQEDTCSGRIQAEDFVITIEQNGMQAYISVLLEKPEFIRKKITKNGLKEILAQSHICKGILEEKLEQIAAGNYGKTPILIAQGEIPHKGEDGWYEFFFRTDLNKKPKILEDGSADYQNVEWFEHVTKDQKIAYYHEAQEGTKGYKVTGEVIEARKGFEQSILTGKGFTLEQDRKTYYAAIDGKIELSGNNLEISRQMDLDEVTMATGNLEFDGSIYIKGDVGNGTTIKATDDVVIDGNVGAATIESGGRIVLKKGMNASGNGYLKADKEIISKFFETVKVYSGGDIQVNSSLNSELFAEGMIHSQLILAGGRAYAEKGFKLTNVGNKAGLHTMLRIGASEQLLRDRKQLDENAFEVERQLQILKNSFADLQLKYPPERRNSMDVFKKIESAIYTRDQELSQIYEQKDAIEKKFQKANEARIVITGQAYEGTVIDMNGRRWEAGNQTNIILKRVDNQMVVLNS